MRKRGMQTPRESASALHRLPGSRWRNDKRIDGGIAMARQRLGIGAGIALLSWLATTPPVMAAHTESPLNAPAFSLQAPSQRIATDTQRPASAPDATQIERLLAGQQLKPAATAPQASADAAAEIADCIARNIRSLDPSNPNWNEKDPRWEPMRQTIALDCAQRREYRIKTVEPELQRMYRDALANSYAQRLSHDDAETLLRFYATETGRRFQAFQNRLTAIEFDAMQKMQQSRAAHGDRASDAMAPPAPIAPAPDVIKRRASILLMSRQILLMVQWQRDAVRSGGDTSGGAVAPIMMSMTATMEGDAIDQIEKDYARDVRAFSAFLASPAEKSEIRALADAQMSFGMASATQLIKLAPEWNGDLQKWREKYRSLPAPAAASAASAPASK